MPTATSPVVSLSFPALDIAAITFDDPQKGANVLSKKVLAEFAAELDVVEQHGGLCGLVIRSGKPGAFLAGADLKEFAAHLAAPRQEVEQLCRDGQHLLRRLSQLPFPSVAAIDGVCLGGGAELALWCNYRVMQRSGKASLGFPEVKIGLFPGWGGSVLLPRVIGVSNAVEMITSGEPLDGAAAAACGLVDELADDVVAASIRLLRRQQEQPNMSLYTRPNPAGVPEKEIEFLAATAGALIQQRTQGKYPAPVAALETILTGIRLSLDDALANEARSMAKLFGGPVNRALINVFLLTDRNKKDSGVTSPVTPRPIESIAVIGAGIMGQGIAVANIKRGIPVVMTDADAKALDIGIGQALAEAAYNKATKQPDAKKLLSLAPLLHGGSTDGELVGRDLIIEAIVESRPVKQSIYQRLEPLVAPETILASNTSTIPITQLAKGFACPERFLGIHFFNPVRKMPLVEIIRGEQTSDETVATAVAYARKIGKTAIVVNDGPGFLVNRLLLPYMNEALELVHDGVALAAIDKAATAFGMPLGPITLYDMVGMDTAMYAGRQMWEAFPDRIAASPIVPALVKNGRLGQKSGQGFYAYAPGQTKGTSDPKVDKIIAPYLREPLPCTSKQITERLFLPVVLEATRALEDKIVRSVRDIDLALILGLGFPPFQGGLLYWADTLGAAKIVEMLGAYQSLGTRFAPTKLLLELASANRRFYELD
jgi:3-hydroxyacyl-CoA dehydrogenase/enoyl-CoA hydratase/3-hydroxybutyryl-CoA epimerase/3-hydroxyacyl-CoA dehydrogenase/enoyl-CoA hydratase/3-hydroxybutyryl-CoA epimerase/enoyl-CoA isomerase